jgi:hypothetical protein
MTDDIELFDECLLQEAAGTRRWHGSTALSKDRKTSQLCSAPTMCARLPALLSSSEASPPSAPLIRQPAKIRGRRPVV